MTISPQVRADIAAKVDALATFDDAVAMCLICVDRLKGASAAISDGAFCPGLSTALASRFGNVMDYAVKTAGWIVASADAINVTDEARERTKTVVLQTYDCISDTAEANDGCGFGDLLLEFVKSMGVVVQAAGKAVEPVGIGIGAILLGLAALVIVLKWSPST